MNIQFENLPAPIQQEILRHLEMNDFREAKRLRDTYQKHQSQKQRSEEDDTDGSNKTTDKNLPENENLVAVTAGACHNISNSQL